MAQATTDNLGFLLAKASARWNELLSEAFRDAGFGDVRPSYGSVLVPLFETEPLRIGEIAARSRLSKQTMTTMVRLCERDGLVERRPDPDDGRATQVVLTARSRAFRPVAERVLVDLEQRVLGRVGRSNQQALERALKGVMEL
ncbi:MAG TPA: MarR family transcriptional regulator [Solirubrobacter sp.]|nr:MarR family transcriptional regulator [Solirubrobacter sp.]